MALSYTMDKIGPITRNADDCDLVLKVISGHDEEDLGSLHVPPPCYCSGALLERIRRGA